MQATVIQFLLCSFHQSLSVSTAMHLALLICSSMLLTALWVESGFCADALPTITDEALETALNDKRYLARQLKCALGEGPCDPVGRKLKSYAPLVLRGNCPRCTPQEVRQIQQVLSHIQRNYPKEWSKMLKQYAGQ